MIKTPKKRSMFVIYLGYALIADSILIFCMFILGTIQGTFDKMPISIAEQTIMIIYGGGITMLLIGYAVVIKEYENHPITSGNDGK